MLLRGLHGLARDERRGFGQRAEDAAAMKPPRALFAEDLLPIDVARPELRHRGVAAVRASDRRARAETPLGEVQPVARGPSYAARFHRLHVRLIDAALIDQVLKQAAHRVVGERGHDRRLHSEAALYPPGDVVFAPAFPGMKSPRRVNSPVARVEPQHHFTERDQVPSALIFRFYL